MAPRRENVVDDYCCLYLDQLTRAVIAIHYRLRSVGWLLGLQRWGDCASDRGRDADLRAGLHDDRRQQRSRRSPDNDTTVDFLSAPAISEFRGQMAGQHIDRPDH